jgi:hypothetical protein
MNPEEKQTLQAAIGTIADPRGNKLYAWSLLCKLAEIHPEQLPNPFPSVISDTQKKEDSGFRKSTDSKM